MAFSFKIIHFLHFLPLLIFFQCLLQLGFYIFPQLFRFQYRHIRGEALGEVGGGYLVGVDQNGHRFLCFVRKRHILAEQVDHIADQRPTDPELEVEVLNIIRRLVDEKQTIVIITHKMSFAREVADKVVFFDEGKILKEGTYTELEQSNIPRITQFLNMLN